MNNLFSSIIRGFGNTLGRKAANSITSTNNESDCYSHRGYEEGDVYAKMDYNYDKERVKWYTWLFFIWIPFLNLFIAIPYFYNIFIKKNYIHWYEMKWNTLKVSDNRFKSGIKEIKKLKPELTDKQIIKSYTRNKIESIIIIIISLLTSFGHFYSSENLNNKIDNKSNLIIDSNIHTKKKKNKEIVKSVDISEHIIYTGSRGGRYYINSNGHKTYIK